MNIINKAQINNEKNLKEVIECQSNDSKNNKFISGKMFENLSEDCGSEGLDKNELYNNIAATVRIKNKNIMTQTINFDTIKETISKKQIIDLATDFNHYKNTEIDFDDYSKNRKIDYLNEEMKMIEEHFINTNRDFKPILYDENLNTIMEEEKLKQTKYKNNVLNNFENHTSNVNEIINKNIIINKIKDKMFQNKPEETNVDQDDIYFKSSNYQIETIRNEIEFERKGDDYYNTLNIEQHFKDTNLVGNYRNEHFANTDDIMIVSFIEDKMKFDRKGIFYGLNKIYLFINKKSGSQEGKTILNLSSKHHKNFDVKDTDINLFNELYQNINVVKIINKQTNNKSKESEDVYVFIIDILDNDRKTSGIENLKIDTSHGKINFVN